MPPGSFSGSSQIFSTDLNGDGSNGGGAPAADVVPGIRIGTFGRTITSWSQLNTILQNYNTTFAGQLTPAGQALVTAGLFTQGQLVQLRAVTPTIALVPTTNPWPFTNLFNLDLGITRPIKLKFISEGFTIEPWFQVFNLLNQTGLGTYGGLDTRFGSLNFDYGAAANQSSTACGGNCVAALTAQRRRNQETRLMQIGFRVSF